MEYLEAIILIVALFVISCILDIRPYARHDCVEYKTPKRPNSKYRNGSSGTFKYNQPKVPKKKD